MNRLETPNGKMPIYLDDIRFIDSIYRNTVLALANSVFDIETNGFIVDGCNVTINGSDLTISEGNIFVSGEYFEVDEHIFSNYVQGQKYFFEIVESQTSQRTFGDGISKNVHTIRNVIISLVDVNNENQTSLNAIEGKRYFDILTKYLLSTTFNASEVVKTDANKKLITESIKTAFNKNFGYNSGDIIPIRTSGSETAQSGLVKYDGEQTEQGIFIEVEKSALNKNFASKTETLAGSSGVVLSPSNLQQHGEWIDIVGLGNWVSNLKVRKLTNGYFHLKGYLEVDGVSSPSLPYAFANLPSICKSSEFTYLGVLMSDLDTGLFHNARLDITYPILGIQALIPLTIYHRFDVDIIFN